MSQAILIGAGSRLAFCELTVVPENGEFLVGHTAAGVFVTLPEIGVRVLRLLQDGRSVSEAASLMAAEGQDVDVLDFANSLLECGFITAVGSVPVSPAPTAEPGGKWLAGIRPETARPFFSPVAWAVYAAAFLFSGILFLVRPDYWPSSEDFFFYPDPALCLLTMFLSNLILAVVHEIWHWLAARAVGVAGRFSISRRLFIPVLETDLSQLWSLPRHKRYGPLLAGMAFDACTLAICLGLREMAAQEIIALAPLLERFLGALVLTRVLGLAWQFQVFMRTDLYAVMVTAAGCTNLYRVTYLYLKRLVLPLNPGEARELGEASARDLAIVRWFAWVYLAGVVLAAWFFVRFFVPGTVIMAGWLFGSIRGADFGTAAFWEAMVIGSISALRALVPLGLFLRDRMRRRKGASA